MSRVKMFTGPSAASEYKPLTKETRAKIGAGNREAHRRRKTEKAMYLAIAAHLESVGWKAIVIGGTRIEQRPGAKYRFSVAVDFTGGKIEAAS